MLGAVEETDNVFSDVENVTGGPGVDSITGDGANNVLSGGGGHDFLDGGAGSNTLHADAGGALMQAGIGADTFDGDPVSGGDVSYANHTGIVGANLNGVADDGLLGTENDNLDADITRIIANDDGDIINASAANLPVTLDGGNGTDFLTGSSHDDFINGGNGNDTINAGPGNDSVRTGAGYGHLQRRHRYEQARLHKRYGRNQPQHRRRGQRRGGGARKCRFDVPEPDRRIRR